MDFSGGTFPTTGNELIYLPHISFLDLKFKIGIRDTNDVFFRVRIGRGSDGRIEMRQFMSDPCLTLILLSM